VSEATIRLSKEGRIARLTISNPDRRNAMLQSMWASLPALCSMIAADPQSLAVILCGQGKHFCAGADITEFEDVFGDTERTLAYHTLVQTALRSLKALDRPVIAEVTGNCIGGGVSLITQCDLVFAEETARFAVTPAKLGLVYGESDTAGLITRIGPARTKDLLFSGRSIDAAEALSIGLIDRIAKTGDLASTCDQYAASLISQSQTSIRAQKSLINAAANTHATPELFAAAMVEAANSADFAEGRRAFLGKRPPDFPSAK
jgi:enoyl-CoA hydratase/carnithine racemase